MHVDKPFPINHRLSTLRDIMVRTDLNDAERRICWFLLLERANSETSLCYCSNNHLAHHLTLNLRTIERAKQRLKALRILTWEKAPGPQTGTSSIYRFYTRFDRFTDRDLTDIQTGTPPVHRPGAPTGPQTGRTNDETYYAQFGSAELEYWDAYLRKTTGNTAPRDKRGGWRFPTRWPVETQQ
jgi:hypothetical protein